MFFKSNSLFADNKKSKDIKPNKFAEVLNGVSENENIDDFDMDKYQERYSEYMKNMDKPFKQGMSQPKPAVVQEEYPLLKAVRDNDIMEVTKLLNDGADIHYADDKGITALWEASYKGSLPIVQLLVRRGAKDIPTKTYGDAKYISRLFKRDKVHEFLCSLESQQNKTDE